MRNHWSQVGRITGDTGKAVEGERASEGSEVVMKRGNARGASAARLAAVLAGESPAGAVPSMAP